VVLGSLSSLSATDSQAACGNTTNAGQFSYAINNVYSNTLQSMVLAAELAARNIKVFMTGACLEGRPEINGAWVID